MADIQINTNGTLTGTKLVVDGKEITKKDKVVSISMSAYAPYKSKYSGDMIDGGASVSFEIVGDDGKVETKIYGTTDTAYSHGIGQKIKNEDSIQRFVGKSVDREISHIIDQITDHCEENAISCRDKEVLSSRTKESLQDMASDLGITLEALIITDEQKENEES